MLMIEDDVLEMFVTEVIRAMRDYESFVSNTTIPPDVKTSVQIKENGTSQVWYSGKDGQFKIVLNSKIPKIRVESKFGSDKYEVVISKVDMFERGTRPVFHTAWSAFNPIFSKIKEYI